MTFVKKDGARVVVLTENLASDAECSEGPVTVYVVGGVLGGVTKSVSKCAYLQLNT
ncbi:MAG: hypothetical protein R3208_18225 [Ketobacteraceae bacterium]|nr:hypothetical protein [Ketobacteraceae bacterium]